MLITGKVKAKGQGREDFRYETTPAKYRVSQTGTFIKGLEIHLRRGRNSGLNIEIFLGC